jgi:hypothetical protein
VASTVEENTTVVLETNTTVEVPVVEEVVVTPVNATLRFDNNGIEDYVVSESDSISVATVNTTDPKLNFKTGERYKISVTNFVTHPLIFNDASGNTLLAMDTKSGENAGTIQGTQESNTEVDFVDDKNGSIIFTLTSELAAALSIYKSQFDSNMTGIFNIDGTDTVIVKEPIATVTKAVVLENVTFHDYKVVSTEDTNIAAVGEKDPAFNFVINERYSFTVGDFIQHPILFNDAQGNTLLGMEATGGSFESDSDVDFKDNGLGTVTFTVTQALADKLSVYRCLNHSDMTGPIVIK